MSPVTASSTASAQRRILSLAASRDVHRAFGWLHLHQPQIRQWLMELVGTPAPPFAESARAAVILEHFTALGLSNPRLDDLGNALAELPAASSDPNQPVLLLSAHLDTVFPAGTPCTPSEEGSRILAPGACDNAAGLSALLALAAAIRHAGLTPPIPILFAANVGEEGEGDLRGIRHLLTRGSLARRIAATLVLEGSGTTTTVTRALGSRRFRLIISGPGGHSWTDAGAPNPIFLLARILAELSHLALPEHPRTTLSVGRIAGGTSINSIPASAEAFLDLRSTDPLHLQHTADQVLSLARASLAQSNADLAPHPPATLAVELVGDRPAADLPSDSPLLRTVAAVDRHLGLRTEFRLGSTDANLPLSLGLPAVALGTGGTAGGIHTTAEWYDPSGREIALRRILLTLLDTATVLSESIS